MNALMSTTLMSFLPFPLGRRPYGPEAKALPLFAGSFQRLICRGVLPPPHSPDKSGAVVSPADKS